MAKHDSGATGSLSGAALASSDGSLRDIDRAWRYTRVISAHRVNVFVLTFPVLAAISPDSENDYVKGWVLGVLNGIHGRPGDIFVLVMLALLLFFLFKKMYRSAVGSLILICGTVLLRVLISILFGL